LSDCGMWTLFFSCEKDKLEQCRAIIRAELDKIMTTPLTKRQLSVAKKQFVGQFAISAENNEAYMLGVGKSYLVFGSVDSVDEVYRQIDQIGPQDIMDVARDLFGSLSSLTYK